MKIFCQNCQEKTVITNARCETCLESICRKCGCTDNEPCIEVCEWSEAGLCSNCAPYEQEDIGERKIFVCLGSPHHLPTLQAITGEMQPQKQSVYWTINKNADAGDKAIFYLTKPISAIVGFGNIITSPWIEEESDWKEKHFTEINFIRIFDEDNFIANREMKIIFPEWIYWTQPRQSVATPEQLLSPFWELLNDRLRS